jgi:hypothetical protein
MPQPPVSTPPPDRPAAHLAAGVAKRKRHTYLGRMHEIAEIAEIDRFRADPPGIPA